MCFFTDQEQEKFDTDGVIQVQFLSAEEVEYLTTLYITLFNQSPDQSFHSTMFVGNVDYRRKIDCSIREIVRPKLGEKIKEHRLLFTNYIVKEARGSTSVGIHQDWSFTPPPADSINFWIPLVDINQKTGLFYALKGSHKTFKNIRYTPYEVDAYKTTSEYIARNATGFSVKAGDALFYHGATVHYTEANTSGSIRLAIGGVLIPEEETNVHYYKNPQTSLLEMYEVDEAFYHRFNFFNKPEGVRLIQEITDYPSPPQLSDLVKKK
jgi:hypothetical protein